MVGQIARAIQEQRAGTEAVVRSAEQVRDITSHVKRAMAEQSKGEPPDFARRGDDHRAGPADQHGDARAGDGEPGGP